MVSDEPKLYIERNGGRYFLLSAVNIEGSLNIGVSLPKAGEYTLRLLVWQTDSCQKDCRKIRDYGIN